MSKQNELRCQIGQQWYGVNVVDVVEVLHFVALTDMPGSPPHVLGLLTLRDMVMPVIDLRLLFGLPAQYRLDLPIITVNTPHGPLGLVVDDVDDVVRVEQTDAYQNDTNLYVQRAARLDDRLLLLLNLERLFDIADQAAARS